MAVRCKVGALLEQDSHLPTDDRVTLTWALRHPDEVPAPALARVLTDHGCPVSPTTVKDHRGSRCACTREGTA